MSYNNPNTNDILNVINMEVDKEYDRAIQFANRYNKYTSSLEEMKKEFNSLISNFSNFKLEGIVIQGNMINIFLELENKQSITISYLFNCLNN